MINFVFKLITAQGAPDDLTPRALNSLQCFYLLPAPIHCNSFFLPLKKIITLRFSVQTSFVHWSAANQTDPPAPENIPKFSRTFFPS